jgi:nitroreductase
VPKAIVARVLDAARWAPSGSNRQPWRVTVVTGPACVELGKGLAARARERQPKTPQATNAPPQTSQNVTALRAGLIEIAQTQGQSLWEFVVLGSYRLYDAPVVVVVSHPGQRGEDVANWVTTMLLAAHDLDLGTCWLGYPLSESDLIRERLAIPEEEKIGAVVALGYPDPDSPANRFRSPRRELEEFVRWVGFD